MRKSLFFAVLFLFFSTNAFAAPNVKPFHGDILVTNEKVIGAVCELWIELGGTFINFSNVETIKKHYTKEDKNNPFHFNSYHTKKYTDKKWITKEKYILDDDFKTSDLLRLYDNHFWRDVKIHNSIFYENSKFNDLEKKIISLLYGHSTNAYKDLLSEKDFYVLEKLNSLGHKQSGVAYKKYEKILRNHKIKQAVIFISITCAILLFLSIVGYILYKNRKKILDKFTKTKTQRLGIIFFILTLVFMCLEEGRFFRLDNEEYLFFILIPLAVSIFMIFGIIDILYKWVFEKNNKK